MRSNILAALALALSSTTALAGPVEPATIARISDQAFNHGEVVETIAYLSDRIGGRLTVRRITIPWSEVEGVDHADDRLYFTRGDENILSFPLAYVGPRREELVRDIYDRLNAANGYTRFEG